MLSFCTLRALSSSVPSLANMQVTPYTCKRSHTPTKRGFKKLNRKRKRKKKALKRAPFKHTHSKPKRNRDKKKIHNVRAPVSQRGVSKPIRPRPSDRLSEATVLKVANQDGYLRALGGFGHEAEVAEEI